MTTKTSPQAKIAHTHSHKGWWIWCSLCCLMLSSVAFAGPRTRGYHAPRRFALENEDDSYHRRTLFRKRFRRTRQRRAVQQRFRRKGRRSTRLDCRQLLKLHYAKRYLRSYSLDYALRHYIRDLRRCRLLKSYDKPRVLVYDYRRCKLVAINQHARTSAASLIKPFVMVAVYAKAYARRIRPSRFPAKLQRHINLMMRVSNNHSTNYLIKHLGNGNARRGMRYIHRVIRRLGIYRTRVVELIPRGGRTYRNTTTAKDLNRLFTRIFKRRAISRGYDRKMLHVMMGSRDNRGRTAYLRARFDVKAATKTGYTKRTNGVTGIVLDGMGLARRAMYNFTVILTRPSLRRANEWVWRRTSTRAIQRISEMIYHYYKSGKPRRAIRWSRNRRKRRYYCRR